MHERRRGKVRVAVLFGGQSSEHDVSLRSAETVMGALDPDRYEVVPIGITREGRWLTGGDPFAALTATSPLFALGDGSTVEPVQDVSEVPAESAVPALFTGGIDVVFPVLHGPMGEDGTVQGLLELTGVPYVGAGVLGSALSMDKAMAKTILAQEGLPQAPWRLITRKEWERDPDACTEWAGEILGWPCFVKPANMGSSVGVVKAHDPSEFPAAMRDACRFDRRILIEKAIDARELEISVLGNDEPIASIVGEVVPAHEFYDFEAKYILEGSELKIPAPIPDDVAEEIRRIAIEAFRAIDCAGMARVDFFYEDGSGAIFLNEINTIPGFTPISMYPKLWEASGIPYSKLIDRLIELALERHERRSRFSTKR
jgi:D-alanine-D-alanine ligase